MPVQNTFTLITEHRAAIAAGPGTSRPMTSKQIKKAHRDANKQPKLSRQEQRKLELAEQERIRKELEQERTASRARAARERKKAKEEEKRQAKRKSGKPLVDVRPSQDTIARFVRGNGSGKKRDGRGDEVGKMRSMTEEPEHKETNQEPSGPTLFESERKRSASGERQPIAELEDMERRGSESRGHQVQPDASGEPMLLEHSGHVKNIGSQKRSSGRPLEKPPSQADEVNLQNPTEASMAVPPLAVHQEEAQETEITNEMCDDDLEDDVDAMDLLLYLSPKVAERGKETTDKESTYAQQNQNSSHEETIAPPPQPEPPDDEQCLDLILEDAALEALVATFDATPSPEPPRVGDRNVPEKVEMTLSALPPLAPEDASPQRKDEFSSFSMDDWDDGMLLQLDGTQPEARSSPEKESAQSPLRPSPEATEAYGETAIHQSPSDELESQAASLSPPHQHRQPPPMSTQAVLLNFDDFFPSPSQQETELECHIAPRASPHTPCPPPRNRTHQASAAVPQNETVNPDPSQPTPQPTKRFFSASGSNELLSLAIHRSRRTAALENIHEQERQRIEAGLLQAKQRSAADKQRSVNKPSMAPPAHHAPVQNPTNKTPLAPSRQTANVPHKSPADTSKQYKAPMSSLHSQPKPPVPPANRTTKTQQHHEYPPPSHGGKPLGGRVRSPGKENNPPEEYDFLPMASQETEFGGDWIDQAANDLMIDACT